MTRNNRARRAALVARLGHRFSDETLLDLALSHSSAVGTAGGRGLFNNQRLEFLGDRVLGLVIAEWLLERFPDAEEGELAVRLNALVRRETCAEVAERVDLGASLVLGAGEDRAGGREKAAILGDACEAVIAALYLDGGISAAARFIKAEWAGLLEGPVPVRRDAKTALQEWTQARGRGIPSYREVGRSGPDHAPDFTVRVQVSGLTPADGTGGSKRHAEQAAARAMLIKEGVWNENE